MGADLGGDVGGAEAGRSAGRCSWGGGRSIGLVRRELRHCSPYTARASVGVDPSRLRIEVDRAYGLPAGAW